MNYKQQLAALGSLGGLALFGYLGLKYTIFQGNKTFNLPQ